MKLAPWVLATLNIVGILILTVGSLLVFMSDVEVPPIPAGWILGMVFAHLGLLLTITLSLTSRIPMAIFGMALIGYGAYEISINPLTLEQCRCGLDTYGTECLPCPMANGLVCAGHGTCDDGYEGSGQCLCENGWEGRACESCHPNFLGPDCNHCKRGWRMPSCEECDVGYTGAQCNLCAEGFENRHGACVCKPGRYGINCDPCPDCTSDGDTLATCEDNDALIQRFPALMDLPDTYGTVNPSVCTPSGETCYQDADCTSGRCRSRCQTEDGTLTEQFCARHDHCPEGQLCADQRSCCVESEKSKGECECGRQGFYGPLCQACPGFDRIYSSSVCSGKGTCAAKYAGNEFTELVCICEEGWTGELCGCQMGPFGCIACANGFYGPSCDQCPRTTQVCGGHGVCSDGLEGDGTCDCFLDLRPGGLGGFQGATCDGCFDEFWGSSCRPCPNLREFGPGVCSSMDTFLPTGNCIRSCNDKVCRDGKDGDGVCMTRL